MCCALTEGRGERESLRAPVGMGEGGECVVPSLRAPVGVSESCRGRL